MDDIIYYNEDGEQIESPDMDHGWVEYDAGSMQTVEIDGIETDILVSTSAVYHPYTEAEQAEYDAQREAKTATATAISDLEDAIIELAALIGGE